MNPAFPPYQCPYFLVSVKAMRCIRQKIQRTASARNEKPFPVVFKRAHHAAPPRKEYVFTHRPALPLAFRVVLPQPAATALTGFGSAGRPPDSSPFSHSATPLRRARRPGQTGFNFLISYLIFLINSGIFLKIIKFIIYNIDFHVL